MNANTLAQNGKIEDEEVEPQGGLCEYTYDGAIYIDYCDDPQSLPTIMPKTQTYCYYDLREIAYEARRIY